MKYLPFVFLSLFLFACNGKKSSNSQEINPPSFQNKGHELVYKMVKKVGDYQTLFNKQDVVYTYTYTTPDGKSDISTEKYIFNGELSYGLYHQHERTLTELEGTMEQGYDGTEYWLKHNGKVLNDATLLKRVKFNRPTNFYWFAMFQKLLDAGLNYEYLGEQDGYDIVKITFNTADGKPTDIYQVYINPKTSLVDHFLFTVADFGVMETPFLMQLEYESIDELLMPTKRQYKKSTWDAAVNEDPWIKVTWTDIKFNNGLSQADFRK